MNKPVDSTPRPGAHALSPPMLPGALPLVGHALEMRNNPVALFQRGKDLHGEIFSIQLPGSRGVVMLGPRANEVFFRKRDEELRQADAYQLMTPIFGKGIAYDAPPHIFKEQLAFFHEALRESRLRTYAQGFIDEAEEFFGKWADEGIVDFYDVGNELTIYTSSRSLLGEKFRRSLSGQFAQLYQELEGGLSLLAFFNPYLPTPAFRRRDRARAKLVELISGIIEERKREGTLGEDFLQTLMEARYKDGRALNYDEITGLLLAIMFAGHHTSGVTFSWTGILLAQHPHWLAELRKEQESVLGGRDDLTLDDLRAMHKLDWTIKEVLRLYPPIIVLMRKVMEGFEFDGWRVDEGVTVFASPAVSQRMPEVFRNPHRFEPDRFGPERGEDKAHPMGWIAFGAGRHRCMGITFAQLQLRALWSHLLRNFEFDLLEKRYEPDYSRLLVGPRHPCRLRFRRLPRSPRRAVA